MDEANSRELRDLGGRAGGDLNSVLGAIRVAADAGNALRTSWNDGYFGDASTPVFLIAIGKASLEMARVAVDRLGDRLVGGVVTAVPERMGLVGLPSCLVVMPADHPLPTARNERAAIVLSAGIQEFARSRGRDGVVCALISGGGSAHLVAPCEGLDLDDLREASTLLQRSGAPIGELNAVRKHTERFKGGRLARLAWPARVEALVLSDVVGDPLDVVASGPFAADPTTFAGALGVLRSRDLEGRLPRIAAHLERGVRCEIEETPKAGDECFRSVRHRVIANHETAVRAASTALRTCGVEVLEERFGVVGESAGVGRALARRAIDWCATAARFAGDESSCAARAWVWGGETSVTVGEATGMGGPSQELALAALDEIRVASDQGSPFARIGDRVGILTFSTDGVDGPTSAAGAMIVPGALRRAESAGVEIFAALRHHASNTALKAMGALLETGPTGTNVNHVAVLVVYPSTTGSSTTGSVGN